MLRTLIIVSALCLCSCHWLLSLGGSGRADVGGDGRPAADGASLEGTAKDGRSRDGSRESSRPVELRAAGSWTQLFPWQVVGQPPLSLFGVWSDPVSPAAFLVGDQGSVLRRTSGTWKHEPIAGVSRLLAVHGTGANNVRTVGTGCAHYHWNGSVWGPELNAFGCAELRGVAAKGAGWAVAGRAQGSQAGLLAVSPLGAGIELAAPLGPPCNALSVAEEPLNKAHYFVACDQGVLWEWTLVGSWQKKQPGTTNNLRGAWARSFTELFVVGEGNLVLRWSGSPNQLQSPAPPSSVLLAAGGDASRLLVVGSTNAGACGSTPSAVGGGLVLSRAGNDALQDLSAAIAKQVGLPSLPPLCGVSVGAGGEVLIVGESGLVLGGTP